MNLVIYSKAFDHGQMQCHLTGPSVFPWNLVLNFTIANVLSPEFSTGAESSAGNVPETLFNRICMSWSEGSLKPQAYRAKNRSLMKNNNK